ncbi:phosphoserine aminotransferase [Bacillus sp. TS-2]|nr:phosphoserine aminotransferase [Bacillus sp. TS-2]
MVKTIYNFNAGPSALPKPVLEKAQKEFLNFKDSGMSLMEMSHRSKVYEDVHNEAQSLLKELMGIPEDYRILFLQGGASLQFSMIPMNFLSSGQRANYVLTGAWSEKALKEATFIGETTVAASSKGSNYTFIPEASTWSLQPNDAYIHITSNNTIFGTQFQEFPDSLKSPLIADMSSDILSREINIENFSMIYAGAQKNLGPSGVTVAIIKEDLLSDKKENIPTMLNYHTHLEANSLFNTPPTYSIYMLRNVLEWLKHSGGVSEIEQRNHEKAASIYEAIDQSNGFYTGHAERNSRSNMNITFNLATEELNKKFLALAKERGFVGLNGHRSVGGCRASIYNAVPLEACLALCDLMKEFQKKN